MKKLTATILIGMGLLMGGCGNNQPNMEAQQTQNQTVQQNNGISLMKAIDLAKKGQFTPQRIQFEAYTTGRVYGDEPSITVTSRCEMGGQNKFVKVIINDPEVIKKVAKLQESRQNEYVTVNYSITADNITFDKYQIYVNEVK